MLTPQQLSQTFNQLQQRIDSSKLFSSEAQRQKFRADLKAIEKHCIQNTVFPLSDIDDALSPSTTNYETRKSKRSRFISRFNLFAAEAETTLQLRHDNLRSQPQYREAYWQADSNLPANLAAGGIQAVKREKTINLRAKERPFKIFVSSSDEDRENRDVLLGLVREEMANYDLVYGTDYAFWLYDIDLYEPRESRNENEQEILKSLLNSHAALPLLGRAFFSSEFITDKEMPHLLPWNFGNAKQPHKVCIPVLMDKFEYKNMMGMENYQISNLDGKGFSQLRGEERKYTLAASVAKRINDLMHADPDPDPEPAGRKLLFDRGLIMSSSEDDRDEKKLSTRAHEGLLESSSAPSASVDCLGALNRWVESEENTSRPIMVLLGEYGFGKTTSCRMFCDQLLESKAKESIKPYLFDLREFVNGFEGIHQDSRPTLEQIIGACLKARGEPFAADSVLREIRDRLKANEAVVIFDGLDEVLVHLIPLAGEAFVRQLLSILPSKSVPDGEPTVDEKDYCSPFSGKLLLSCRSSFFPTLTSQVQTLSSRERYEHRRDDFASLVLLPFSLEQIRRYFKLNLPGRNPDEMMKLLANIHDLTDLARRPYNLQLIRRQIGLLEKQSLQGKPVNTASIYTNLMNDWIERDFGKHQISADHKPRFMEALALYFWQKGVRRRPFDEISAWFDNFVMTDPVLTRLYGGIESRDTFLEDLRTATFITRPDDEQFSFAHTSILEFFLARRLLKALEAGDFEVWSTVRASRETMAFILDLLDLAEEEQLSTAHEQLSLAMAAYDENKSENVFELFLLSAERGQPIPRAGVIDLGPIQLDGRTIAGKAGQLLDLRGLKITGGRLHLSRFFQVNLSGAVFEDVFASQSVWSECDLTKATFSKVELGGAIFRKNTLDDSKFDAHEYATIDWIDNFQKEPRQSLNADGSPLEPVALTGHSGWVQSAVISPDGSEILTASSDNTARLWDAKTGKERTALEGHSGRVQSAVFSPDGSEILTASSDNTARLWDAKTGKERIALKGHSGRVQSAVFSPDGSEILTASSDNTARLWDAKTGKERIALEGHSDYVLSAVFSADGSEILTASDDNTARLWDAKTGKERIALKGHSDYVLSAAFSADGSEILTASSDKTARLWNAKTGKERIALKGHSGSALSAAFSPEESEILTASSDNTARLWDAKTGKERIALKGHSDWVQSAVFSADGSEILTASDDKTARLWDAKTGKERIALKGHSGRVLSAVFSADGSEILTASDDNTARLWDAKTGKERIALKGHSGKVQSAVFSADGSEILTASYDNTAMLWDAKTGKERIALNGHSGRVLSAVFSADGSEILTASDDNTARLWDAKTGKERIALKGHSDWVQSAVFSPDGSEILTASSDKTARLWDAKTGKERAALKGHSDWVQSAVFSPDGSEILTASDDNTARLWDAKTGKERIALKGHSHWVQSAVFSADGSEILTASYDNTARLWDAKTGKERIALKGHSGKVQSAVFSADGSEILTASYDKTARLWDAKTGKERIALKGHSDYVLSAVFSPDGSEILTASSDKTARLWDAKTGKERAAFLILPEGNTAAFDLTKKQIISASPNAWLWLGWQVVLKNGEYSTIPAEQVASYPTNTTTP